MSFTTIVDPALVIAAGVALVAAATYFYYYSPQANQPDLHPLQMAQQASVSDVRESSHESAVYRSKQAPHRMPLHSTPPAKCTTLRELFRAGRASPRADALLTIRNDKLLRMSTADVEARVRAVASNLLARMPGNSVQSVAIVLPASVSFAVAYQACVEAGIVAIPIAYAESAAHIKRIIAHAQPQALITTATRMPDLAAQLGSSAPGCIVTVGALKDSDTPATPNAVTFAELEQQPDADVNLPAVTVTDVAYVLYESQGNDMHGVAVTHANALAAVAGLQSTAPPAQMLSSKDVYMSVATPAVAVNLALLNMSLGLGCAVAMAETSDAEVFVAQAEEIQPSITFLHPALVRDLVQLFYTHTRQLPVLERWVFAAGYRRVVDSLRCGIWPRVNFWDVVYFRHYRNMLGGRLRLMFVDAVTTPSRSIEWIRAMHGARVLPVFAPAEAAGAATAGLFFDYASVLDTHNAGPPLPCNEIKLVDHADLQLLADDEPNPRGAIAIRGPNVSAVRWNDSSAKLDDGWLLLPYLGEMLPNGALEVLGRTSSAAHGSLSGLGKQAVVLEQLDRAFLSSSSVVDACAVSLSQSKLNIMVYPRTVELPAVAKRLKKEFNLAQVNEYQWCIDYIRERLVKAAANAGFSWITDIPAADIHVKIVTKQFSLSNGLLLTDGSYNRSSAKKHALC
ncbi:medium-chain fatty acid-CoA ligase faa2 [Coemansia sp. RSA 1250]|nr:medium-chain fatty acid-CoA ligase faa2 [Coemansia sp. RSA 1250]